MFGLTLIRFLPYALATFVFMIPGAFAYAYPGYATCAVVGSVTHAAPVKQVLVVTSTVAGLLVLLNPRRVDAQIWHTSSVSDRKIAQNVRSLPERLMRDLTSRFFENISNHPG